MSFLSATLHVTWDTQCVSTYLSAISIAIVGGPSDNRRTMAPRSSRATPTIAGSNR